MRLTKLHGVHFYLRLAAAVYPKRQIILIIATHAQLTVHFLLATIKIEYINSYRIRPSVT